VGTNFQPGIAESSLHNPLFLWEHQYNADAVAAKVIANPAVIVIKYQRNAKGIHCGSACASGQLVTIKPDEYLRLLPGSRMLRLETSEIDARWDRTLFVLERAGDSNGSIC
jgi:hypothetical protein